MVLALAHPELIASLTVVDIAPVRYDWVGNVASVVRVVERLVW